MIGLFPTKIAFQETGAFSSCQELLSEQRYKAI